MDYTEIKIQCPELYKDLVIFEISAFGNITFSDEWNSLNAYYPNNPKLHKKIIGKLEYYCRQISGFSYFTNFISHQNWNKVWEENYQPVKISEKYIISAPFHHIEDQNLTNIIIHPAMAFGTGHHSTTKMMIELMEKSDFINKSIADFGCGTAVLSIIAEKKGSSSVLAFDNDIDSVKSSRLNIGLNNCTKIKINKGSATQLKHAQFDIILANINLNTLLKFKKNIADSLKTNGLFICSGFRKEDISVMKSEFLKLSLLTEKILSEDEWTAMLMKKIAIHE